jgi:predicted dehydrogenase
MGDRLGVCVIGCGDMGAKHAERWSKSSGCRVVAVCDPNEERAARLAAACGLDRWHTDYRQAIDRADVDVVSVCIRTSLHAAVSVFAAEHGKHTLSEKPIALTLADAESMVEAARRNRVRLTVGLMRRYSPVLPALRDWLAADASHRPALYQSFDSREIRPKREMHDSLANGGPVIDMGVHLYDNWSVLFGSQPVQVYAQALKLAKGRAEISHISEVAYDTATVTVRYASGDIGTFHPCWGLPPGVNPPGDADRLYTPAGEVRVSWGLTHQEAVLQAEGGARQTLCAADVDLYQAEIDAVARSILRDEPLPVSVEEAVAALRVALAAVESAGTGLPVTMSRASESDTYE